MGPERETQMLGRQPKEDKAAALELEREVSREDIVSAFRTAMVDHFRSHVPGTNINESTLLASDYLNHFHEAVMLLEAVAADPEEFSDDLAAWRPITYEEHFHSSGFRDKNLAIAAYRRAPQDVRRTFDEAVAQLKTEAEALVDKTRVALRTGAPESLRELCSHGSMRLRDLIQRANAIATGEAPVQRSHAEDRTSYGQDVIDALLEEENR